MRLRTKRDIEEYIVDFFAVVPNCLSEIDDHLENIGSLDLVGYWHHGNSVQDIYTVWRNTEHSK